MARREAPQEWSPLRPKSISSRLAAVADSAPDGSSQFSISAASAAAGGGPAPLARARAGGRSLQELDDAFTAADAAPAIAARAFELPENVSRRPLTLRNARTWCDPTQAPAAKAAPGNRGKRPHSGAAPPSGPAAKRSRFRLSGPQRAAARRRNQYFAKKSVQRRVALWRSRIVDGERQLFYVTLGGEALPKGGRAFRAATTDQKYLKSLGIASNRPANSAIGKPEDIEPYAVRRSEDPRSLSHWCVPEVVEASYRDAGVKQLYPWQAACLSGEGVLDGRSLVYVAPTSAGKSLVCEVLALRQLLFRGRRALIVLPFVSICSERTEQLRRLWGGSGIRVEALFAASDGQWHAGVDVAVCTIEKASSLLNRLLEDDALLRDVGVLVLDELHLLGEEHRGYILELIILKARLSAAASSLDGSSSGLQIIGLSATLPNVQILAEWLHAHLHISDARPVPLSMAISLKGTMLGPDGVALTTGASNGADAAPGVATSRSPGALVPASKAPSAAPTGRDPDGVVPLVRDCTTEGHSVLVFCATKDWCEKAATMLSQELPAAADAGAQELMDARFRILEELRQSPGGLCPVLAKSVQRGVAYHHAGLTIEERTILERAYRSGSICCLCATSTLAAGVNLPARRVIIRSMKVGMEQLDPIRFRQMAGRAGRAGLDSRGECIVVAKTGRDVSYAQELFSAELQPLRSSLHGQRLARALLECISLGLVRTCADLSGVFAKNLLRYHEEPSTSGVSALPGGGGGLGDEVQAALRYLVDRHLVRADGALQADGQATQDSSGSGGAAGAEPTTVAAGAPAAATASALVLAAAGAAPADSTISSGDTLAAGALDGSSGSVAPIAAPICTTPLGDGVVHSSLKPEDALVVFEHLQKARGGVHLDTELHLIFLATPVTGTIEPDWTRVLSIYERLPPRDRSVADVVGVSHRFLMQQTLGSGPGPRTGTVHSNSAMVDWRLERERISFVHRRFWAALALNDLVAEKTLTQVAAAYAFPRGALQALQTTAATYCSMVQLLCERLRWSGMAALFQALMPRISFGVSAEIVPLCKVPGVFPPRARALLEAGYGSPEELAKASLEELEVVLRRTVQFESTARGGLAHQQELVVRETASRILQGAQELVGAELQKMEDEAEDMQKRMSTAASGGRALPAGG